jgi:hypothetical protein
MSVMIYDRLAILSCMCSYRRVGGSDFAQLLKVCFQKVGVDVFLDVDNRQPSHSIKLFTL